MKRRGQSVRETQTRRLDLVRRYKASVGCSRCDESDPRCLDLHHHERKSIKLTRRLVTGGGRWQNLSYDEILTEIAKCEVVCSNCHRKETFGALTTPVPLEKHSPSLLRAERILGLA